MRRVRLPCIAGVLGGLLGFASSASAHPPPLLPENVVAALANELSGETAKRNLEGISRLHRQRASREFHAAAELIAERGRAYGLSNVQILQFPADGKTMYGTQKSRMGWDAEEGELSEIRDGREIKLASYSAEPTVLAEDSESADVTADLVDVGSGTSEQDYSGKAVRGRLVLISGPAGDVQDMAVGKFGAAGIISAAQNQMTAWWGDNDNLVRWGHLESFTPNPTFAFMVSLKTARGFKERLQKGEKVTLHAHVKAGQHPSSLEIVTATIDGADAEFADSEIAFSCHLDHPRPGANDNASGCVTILEVARTLQRLIAAGQIPRPARTLRFIWPPEIEGTTTLLNAKPEFAARIRAVIHMDMVGGSPETKAVFHVTRGPLSLPSFIHDIAWAFASWINTESYEFAASGSTQYPLIAPEGGKEPLRAEYSSYSRGSDHDVYQDSAFSIPAIYLNDWPDRYIHTNFDTAANIDPTKLKRAGLIGAASGYFLAGFATTRRQPAPAGKRSANDNRDAVLRAVSAGRLLREFEMLQRAAAPAAPMEEYERRVTASVDTFGEKPATRVAHRTGPRADSGIRTVYYRIPEPRGPMEVFGYGYFEDHAERAGVATPGLLSFAGAWGSGGDYAAEALNLVDGKRTVGDIHDVLSAEYGAVPQDLVTEYLQDLYAIGVLE